MKYTKRNHKLTQSLQTVTMLVVFAMLNSCTEDLAKEIFGQRTPIEISASIEDMKMKLTTRTSNMNLNSGGFTISGEKDVDNICINIDGVAHAYSISGETGNNTTELIADQEQYFPIGASSVDVYAHYPYEAGFSSINETTYFTIEKDQRADVAYLKSDLMTADNSPATRTKQGNGTWVVNKTTNLIFKHQLTKINVNVIKESGSSLTVKKVLLNHVKPRVSLTYNDGKYSIGTATTDANGKSYDMTLLDGVGSASVIIPPQAYSAASNADSCQFVTILVDGTNPNTGEQVTDFPIVYYFRGSGKNFRSGHVYTATFVIGDKDIDLYDEYFVRGVELSKWAADDDATDVHVSAAVEKMSMVGQTGITITPKVKDGLVKVYNGSPITLTVNQDNKIENSEDELLVLVTSGEGDSETTEKLVYGDDYTLSYSTNINAGTAYIAIMGVGKYAGSLEASFEISEKDISDESVSMSVSPLVYNGEERKPVPAISDTESGKTLTSYDYILSYDHEGDRTHANTTTAYVTVIGRGNYKGSKDVYFTINKAAGGLSFREPSLSFIKPEGKWQFDYINDITIEGDGVLQNCSSSNSSVVAVDNTGKITVKQAGTAVISFNIKGENYDYSSVPTYTVNVRVGPKLPIEYVAEHDMKSGTEMAEDDSSLSSCILLWMDSKMGDPAQADPLNQDSDNPLSKWNKNLCKNGLTKDGIHYHFPSTWELESIFATGATVHWTATEGSTILGQTDAHVQFGVTVKNKTTDNDEQGYEYGITHEDTENWETDCYSTKLDEDGNASAVAIRFKNSTYCCAYRYDYLMTTDANRALTGNEIGYKTYVVRVIYLGPMASSTYGKDELYALDWENPDEIRRFPCNGIVYDSWNHSAGFTNKFNNTQSLSVSTPTWKWLWSCTPQNEARTQYHSVRLVGEGLQGYQAHNVDQNFSVRMFKDR